MINAAGPDLAPADRKLYALRDITGTVESIPLIASSIMSKKIAEGTRPSSSTSRSVRRVHHGAGRPATSSESMVELGAAHGVRTTALLTQMDVPLGLTAGNALEVGEAVEVLAGGGPADVVELTVDLAREMLELAGVRRPDPAGVLADGRAMDVWRRMVRAQGGDSTARPAATRRRGGPAPATGTSPASRRWPSAWRPGAWARAAAARRTPSPPPPASSGARPR